MNNFKVEQFMVKNQFRIYGKGVNCLQSYNSLVVKIETQDYNNYKITLGRDWDYSTTTSKYVYMFLEEYSNIRFYGVNDKRNYIRKLIEQGIIQYDNDME